MSLRKKKFYKFFSAYKIELFKCIAWHGQDPHDNIRLNSFHEKILLSHLPSFAQIVLDLE